MSLELPISPCAFLTNAGAVRLRSRVTKNHVGSTTHYSLFVENPTRETIVVDRIRIFSVRLPDPEVEIFRNGFAMPGDATGFYLLKAGAPLPALRRGPFEGGGKHDFNSHSLVVLDQPSARKRLLLGFTTFDAFQGYFMFSMGGRRIRLSAWYDMLPGTPIPPRQEFRLEDLMVSEGNNFPALIGSYADYSASRNHARVMKKTVTGWLDWQYYRENKSEVDVLRSVAVLKKLRRTGFPMEYVIVDGGWCNYASEWLEPCGKFPSGMKRLSQRLRRDGFKLGLWLAPYITNAKTRVACEHPDWLVKNKETRKPLYHPSTNVGPAYVIDFSVPEAQAWLRNIVRTMVRDWKVGYIKLDGPRLTYYQGVLHDPSMSLVQQARRTFQIIREECGESVLVEGEGSYGPAIGYVDLQRTTSDNHPLWCDTDGKPLLKRNMQEDLMSALLHRRFWHNHRENIILRDFCSPFHAWKTQRPQAKDGILSENEMLLQLSAASMAGGAMLLTDPLDELVRNPKAVERISQIFPHFESRGCIPIDVFQKGRQPSLYYLPIRRPFGEWYILGVFNWEDLYQDFTIPLDFCGVERHHAFEFWTQEYLGCHARRLVVSDVPAHGCRLIALRRNENRAQFLGDNIHLFQGAVELAECGWNRAKLSLTVDHARQQDRRLFLWRPEGYVLGSVRTNAKDHLVDCRRKNLVIVCFNGRRRTTFEFVWERR